MRCVGMEPYLPSSYVLKRWTRDANSSTKRGKSDSEIDGNEMQSVKRNALTKRIEEIVNMALQVPVAYDLACRSLDELKEGLTRVIGGSAEGRPSSNPITRDIMTVEDPLKFSDPPLSQCKGKRKPNRFKAPADIRDAKKMQTCSYCHKKAGHDWRTCLERIRDMAMTRSSNGIHSK